MEVRVDIDKTVIEVADFIANVPYHDTETGEVLKTELRVRVEITNGDRTYGISTQGDFDIMDYEEAHILAALIQKALLWNPKEEA